VTDGTKPLDALPVKEAIRAGEAALVGTGRLLIRKSGTEPVIRVMAEGEDEVLVLQVVDEIARAIEVAGRG
jgi:phosphoglucosamine mutase